MMVFQKNILPGIYLGFFFAVLLLYGCESAPETAERKLSKGERIEGAMLDNNERTKDLSLGYPPIERLLLAQEQTRRRQEALLRDGHARNNDVTNPRWRERGPDNIGGRSRAMLIDIRDPERKTLWAGAVAGGLWKTHNITAPNPLWQKVSDFLDNLSVGALAQDTNNPNLIFMGTGEGYGSLSSIAGLGIFRSTNGGITWNLLPSSLANNLNFTQDMLIHPTTGDVYAATNIGLWRSKDQGDSWQKVLGGGFGVSNFFNDILLSSDGYLLAAANNALFRSTSGDAGSWENLTGGKIQESFTRIEATVCESAPNVMYLIGSLGGVASRVYRSGDGGQTWVARARPENNNGTEFTNGQAWYDLDIAVDPYDPNHIIAGGVPLRQSVDGGFSWQPYASSVHVDQHLILFDKTIEGVVYLANDGGIYRVDQAKSGPVSLDRNQGYNVTQFYACAIHPEPYYSYFLGGTQDNNSLQITGPGIQPARVVRGGDGLFCHIDELDPRYQMVSSQNGRYSLSTDGGASWEGTTDLSGSFYSPSDYDSESKIMYAQTTLGGIYRWHIVSGQAERVDIDGIPGNFNISTILVDPTTPNRIYMGSYNLGRIFRIDNAHDGDPIQAVQVANFGGGTVSSIDVDPNDPDHLLATLSNYGLANNIYEFRNGTWFPSEGTGVPNNLPDMPVRWGVFNPQNTSQAAIATELGVWTTDLLDGNNTIWYPPMPGRGTPLTRTDMLQVRASDRLVLAATHGRGMFTSDVFADPHIDMAFIPVGYQGVSSFFRASESYQADFYEWSFGDGNASEEEDVFHTYNSVGTYEVSLKIRDDLQTQGSMSVLPALPAPYAPGGTSYGGDFEAYPEQAAAYSVSGSVFERGKSTIPGKDGTRSGDFAWVLGLDEVKVQDNTEAYLYLPNFDLGEAGIYEFSFWAKFDLQPTRDGFRVEYSEDGGASWEVLGENVSNNWYNTLNGVLPTGAFPIDSRYFSRRVENWTRFFVNISQLSGRDRVAFRFVFRSDDTGSFPGLAIDDVTVSRYEGALETMLVDFQAEYTGATEITVKWTTQPEFHCRRFVLERSMNGKDFESVHTSLATGGSTEVPQMYSHKLLGQRALYFLRLLVVNENDAQGYAYEFYSDPLSVRRAEGNTEVHLVFPNPFNNYIDISLTDTAPAPVRATLYHSSGQRILQREILPEGVLYGRLSLDTPVAGVYFLEVQIGNQKPQTFRLLGGAF
jgi:photosystem II stability/assembly factor-like uncharacterized protein